MAWVSDRRPVFADQQSLLPVVVQDADDGTLLMLAWANAAAVTATEQTGEAHFWSRSRGELWRKGATSGNVLEVIDLAIDCDGDAIRYRVRPRGPACHTGARGCFDQTDAPFGLAQLEGIIGARRDADPAASYTARLLAGGPRRAAEKVVEEAGELAAAALVGSDDEVRAEAADLFYHSLVLLAARRISLSAVLGELAGRHTAARHGAEGPSMGDS